VITRRHLWWRFRRKWKTGNQKTSYFRFRSKKISRTFKNW